MTDVVVTVPKWFWPEWLAEGGLPGSRPRRQWVYTVPTRPKIEPGERVYVVSHGRLRGYAPLIEIVYDDVWCADVYGLVRGGGAAAVTIDEPIKGFRGYRYRWWKREDEVPFPDWQNVEAA